MAMEIKQYFDNLANKMKENRLLKFAITFQTIVVLACTLLAYGAVKSKTVVLIPMDLKEDVTIKNGTPDDKYVDRIVRESTNLALTYSPATARWQFDRLLELVAPESYPRISEMLYEMAADIEEARVSSVFYVREILVDPKEGAIKVSGDRKQFVDDSVIEDTRKVFILKYRWASGRFYLTDFYEKKGMGTT